MLRIPSDLAAVVGLRCYNVAGTEHGEITSYSICNLSGCGGIRLHVKWPDKKRTRPCARGCKVRDDGHYQIR